MGRRKIEIQYLQDDRVRKVTFCKRKGGLFKKADDLAKLCGVEVAVIIITENQQKTCTYASTDLDRVVKRYQDLNAEDRVTAPVSYTRALGCVLTAPTQDSQIDELYNKLEIQRRELEKVQRELLQERKKVEAFVGQDVQMLTVRPVDMSQVTNFSAQPMAQQMVQPALVQPMAQAMAQPQFTQAQAWQAGTSAAADIPPAALPGAPLDSISIPVNTAVVNTVGVPEQPDPHPAKRAKLDEPLIQIPEAAVPLLPDPHETIARPTLVHLAQ